MSTASHPSALSTEVPSMMDAQVVRADRFGPPAQAFRIEQVPTPEAGPGEVLIKVMAAGINYNNVWAARGIPVNVIAMRQRSGEPHDFHIGGSDAAGYVVSVGPGVTGLAPGDAVVTHPGHWDSQDPWVVEGRDPMLAPSAGIWGYDTNFGAFGQYCIAQAHQVMPKAAQLTWAQAAASTLVGTTAYRMMFGWAGNQLGPGQIVLIWGGSGGVGSLAIQLARWAGATPIAVVSSPERGKYCMSLGAHGYVDRSQFDHWGPPPHWTSPESADWAKQAQRFGRAFWDVLGERRNPDMVVEHPGETTVPTSIYLCSTGGMVVICAGTTGYSSQVDLRYLWARQKRFQGSHGTNDQQAYAYNKLIMAAAIDPALGEVVAFEDIGLVHERMGSGTLAPGNAVALVNAVSEHEGVGIGEVVNEDTSWDALVASRA
jgi:crotonyl-CoA carboxylase/reductase